MLTSHLANTPEPPSVILPLFDSVRRCHECQDIGFVVSKDGEFNWCWRARAGAEHNKQSPAAFVLQRAVEQLRIAKITIEPHIFYVARQIAAGTSAEPVKREKLIEGNFTYSKSPLRMFHKAVETLRSVWLLPVGSRKEAPAGYWICTDQKDFAEWVERAKSAPVTQLSTIHRVAKRNFPLFAEQLELQFFNDILPVLEDVR